MSSSCQPMPVRVVPARRNGPDQLSGARLERSRTSSFPSYFVAEALILRCRWMGWRQMCAKVGTVSGEMPGHVAVTI